MGSRREGEKHRERERESERERVERRGKGMEEEREGEKVIWCKILFIVLKTSGYMHTATHACTHLGVRVAVDLMAHFTCCTNSVHTVTSHDEQHVALE